MADTSANEELKQIRCPNCQTVLCEFGSGLVRIRCKKCNRYVNISKNNAKTAVIDLGKNRIKPTGKFECNLAVGD